MPGSIRFQEICRIVKFMETGSRMVVTRVWGKGKRELFSGYRVSVLEISCVHYTSV
jgi:hypothetical protein